MTSMCTVEDCNEPCLARSLCRVHYRRLKRNGHTDLVVLRGEQILTRLLAKVTVDPASGCWLWNGYKIKTGYGRIAVSGTRNGMVLVHRVTYEHFVGPIPEGLELDHLCHVRNCCNPAHVEPVTHLENVRRKRRKPRPTHCPAGHAYDEANTRRDVRGSQVCRACGRDKARRYSAAKKRRVAS